ncbi:hypothetical protein GALMADRAFT_241500 [Galerina marginata CBS 339.88]|uniref:Uncharacterized protein n=1 Tax=Galerina marginata (strain CBS 339.88) TaxID=685588 RepID=A0A067TF49_GALM3|nr:hypothetical protein GALMADRAFT_241500 [Galerina marginata CBS 339.88]
MARGSQQVSPPAASSLPKVEFEIIHDDKLKLPGGTHDNQARTFGYNDFTHFNRPDHYIRHIEPLESDLAKIVEYDMDEQDQDWLDLVNVDRKKGQVDLVMPEAFEIIMDRLEKEWFDLTKNIPKADFAMPSEDSTCAICDDSEGENSNAIVFCDGCNLAVHQDCYGVPYIPEGQWLCRKCTVSPENPVSCYLCPNEGGAFKQTTHGEWVHLLCAIWIPETRVANEVFMEPVTGVERISKQRWKLRCSVCEVREGACIQCTKPSCFVAFHATCARKEKLLMPMKSAQGAEPASLTCFCDRHLPTEQQEIRAAALEGEEEKHERTGANASKSARAYAKTYKPGPPLVPAIIVKRIMDYTARIKIRKKLDFIQLMCRYWSLKREARRGAPLLKRLHLEPWTASAGAKVLSDEEKLMRLDQLKRLRQDLINVRALTDLCRKREIRKHRQTDVVYEVLSQSLFPGHLQLRNTFERIQGMDRHDYFKNPVSKSDVPDYFEVVKNPMCWTTIDSKLDQHKYWNVKEFKDDMELVLNNALLYNKAGTVFHKAASKIKKDAKPHLDAIESCKYLHHPSSWAHLAGIPTEAKVEEAGAGDEAEAEASAPIGDLEPPVNVLELLLTSDAIKEDLNMEIDGDPVSTMVDYTFATMKPPPLNPPSPPPATATQRVRKSKSKRDRKAEAERSRANKEARESARASTQKDEEEGETAEMKKQRDEFQALLDASAGFRAPRTRGAIAAAEAFEAEAHGSGSASAGPSQPPESISEGSKADKSKKRASVAPQPSVLPQLVDHVGNRDSFSMFHAGWILPPDQKRGGRVGTERTPMPPPRKRQKTEHGSSRLSIVSTAPSENYSSRRTPPFSSDPPEMKHNPDNSMDMEMEIPMDVDVKEGGEPSTMAQDQPESISRPGALAGDENIDGPHNVVTQPNGVVIIEKLDTPAIRRERNQRKKAERQRQATLTGDSMAISAGSSNLSTSAKQPSPPPSHSAPPVPQPPQPQDAKKREEPDHETLSELSELSDETDGQDDDDYAEDGQPVQPVTTPTTPRLKTTTAVRPKRTPKVQQFIDGTIVWAKADSFPWWPAVIHADTSTAVPPNILESYKDKKQKRKVKLYIVQFYDRQASWQSVPRDKLQILGEDKEFDAEMLKTNAKQKWKSASSKRECREAYEIAIAEMDMDGSSGQPDQSQADEDHPEAQG